MTLATAPGERFRADDKVSPVMPRPGRGEAYGYRVGLPRSDGIVRYDGTISFSAENRPGRPPIRPRARQQVPGAHSNPETT
jgi:hypothetical protein